MGATLEISIIWCS